MLTKNELVSTYLRRYTGKDLSYFGKYIILTNFNSHLKYFADLFKQKLSFDGEEAMITCTNDEGITMINFGLGTSLAATILDLLVAVNPKFVIFIGKCAGLKRKLQIGDYIIPLSAIRGDGTSNDYYPPEIPAIPFFPGQKIIGEILKKKDINYSTGVIYTTNRRVWEFDDLFLNYLYRIRVHGVEMELATLFSVAHYNSIPISALISVSDKPFVGLFKNSNSDEIEAKQRNIENMVDIALETIRVIKNENILTCIVDDNPNAYKNTF